MHGDGTGVPDTSANIIRCRTNNSNGYTLERFKGPFPAGEPANVRDDPFMKIQELIGTILASSKDLGSFRMADLLKFTQSKKINGLAVAKEEEREFDLAFLEGEPEGAILIDEKGTLYGDKAVMLLSGNETFQFFEVEKDLVEAVIQGCRILEKGHIRKNDMAAIEEIGKKSDGLGILTIIAARNNEPQNGVRVSIRKDGQMICTDITTEDGSVGFKLLHDRYDCIIRDRSGTLTTFHIKFDDAHTRIIREI
jgi:hypothetical protein